MQFRGFVPLCTCALLATGCIAPPPSLYIGDTSAVTYKDAEALLARSTSNALATRFAKADSPPVLKKVVLPSMSKAAVRHGGAGYVDVEVHVEKDGRVSEVRVLWSPNQYASEDTQWAVMQWVFDPLIERGEPKAFKYRQPFRFELGKN